MLEVKDIRSRLQAGCVCEVIYADEMGVYLAQVVSTPAPTAKKVDIIWLHEVVDGSNMYIADPWTHGTKRCWIREVAEPISATQKLVAAEAETILKRVEFSQALDEIRMDENAQLPALVEVWRRSAAASGVSTSSVASPLRLCSPRMSRPAPRPQPGTMLSGAAAPPVSKIQTMVHRLQLPTTNKLQKIGSPPPRKPRTLPRMPQ